MCVAAEDTCDTTTHGVGSEETTQCARSDTATQGVISEETTQEGLETTQSVDTRQSADDKLLQQVNIKLVFYFFSKHTLVFCLTKMLHDFEDT